MTQLSSITISPNLEPTGLFVLLHGWGANCNDLTPLATQLNLPDYWFEFPDAPLPHPQVPQGKMWYDLESLEFQGLVESRQILIDWLISLESKTGIPLSKTILCGFSQGGAMAMDVGVSLPIKGLIILSGYLHSQLQPSGEKLPPVLVVHGIQDPVLPIEQGRRTRDTFTNLGANIQYQEFNMGHEIIPEIVKLMRSFVIDTMAKA
ncbi:MAG: alpha/beta hydrolase [Okeania sp. SIO2G4]|uniref:alpha/beta hydrolase n=1 Tax=unclassified Okeania TaxID=2634635 RepID=UPI0013B5EBDD|nr:MULTISPECIES: dienelactone hydrolase family protein [unclassified Okeania]NEP07899.1 alpha/beta hydrolase [Okeania sp. SIO4D6]NEP38170.1 alpha/beta hydrolase [Okeania sp. SIO2H7]NEP72771.1 alpha/beta hydrolase [Okeania sp. SIO2G5]NEP93461.1 alpha/beta hydrolase [Okeania sp. SIO2F5]NEQ89758.1 alpha/beta hydrolase [Okeania sp. SIO2G4]